MDQILPQSVDPRIFEPYVQNARRYVELAEEATGPIPQPVDYDYIWGNALAVIERVDPALRIINLETAVTAAGDPWYGKGIHYRMHPANVAALKAAGIPKRFTAHGLRRSFNNLARQETADAILFGTGFKLSLPFLDEATASTLKADDQGIDLYAETFHPDLPGLAWSADFFIVHKVHYIAAAVLIALAFLGILLYYVVVALERIFAGWAERAPA